VAIKLRIAGLDRGLQHAVQLILAEEEHRGEEQAVYQCAAGNREQVADVLWNMWPEFHREKLARRVPLDTAPPGPLAMEDRLPYRARRDPRAPRRGTVDSGLA
jgi:hypothetical protein